MNLKAIFLLLIIIPILSGCWSTKELNDLALISALGIDKNDEGEYVGTFQIINPANVTGGVQGGGGGQGPSVTVFTATGDNLVEMSRRASTIISRRLYYSHTNLLVLNEKLAKEEGINKLFDAFIRDPEFRSTATVVIAHDTDASDIVKTLTAVDKIPANKVIKTLKFTESRWGEHLNVNIQDALKKLLSSGNEPVISGFRLVGNKEQGRKMENIQQTALDAILQADGLAIFKEGKLVNWYQEKPARGILWILDKIKTTDINVSWKKQKNAIAYQVVRQKTEVSAVFKNNRPQIFIKVRAEGDIGEASVPVNLNDPVVIFEIEKVIEKEIKNEIKEAVQLAKEDQTDIFGFGEAVYRSNPAEWKKLKNDWNDVHFTEIKVDVKVDAFIRRTGMIKKPQLSEMDK
ncbi:Ger(x)C family spore germination protein [Metabacillus idriensis]|uniref:Ger(x)C family spore germination protein n=1 Tax=Metabacillus idriensis TaxID=324768 RepID=UPI001749EFCE|nr:Ger(x)C family spore germination protein [Metabacillus idriensis]